MSILYLQNQNKKDYIAYNKLNIAKKEAPTIIFHHGLMSGMGGIKALYLEKYCTKAGYNYVRFDNYGHGKSSGDFSDQTISSWLLGLNSVIDKLSSDKVLLVGSSMGAWITTLSTIDKKDKIIGMVCISAAIDFTEELIWSKISPQEKLQIQSEGIIRIGGENRDCGNKYPISYNLIEDGRNHILLDKKVDISCPVHLIHGMQDIDVPHSISQRLCDKISGNQVVLKLIKDADHKFARPQDLQLICSSIQEIISQYDNYQV